MARISVVRTNLHFFLKKVCPLSLCKILVGKKNDSMANCHSVLFTAYGEDSTPLNDCALSRWKCCSASVGLCIYLTKWTAAPHCRSTVGTALG